jgi:chromosome partitioning protein
MSYIITIANEKGGVAKTTTALSLGAAIVEQEKRVLLVDLDPQANLTLALGSDPSVLEMTMAGVLMGRKTIPEVLIHTKVPNLDLAPANEEMLLAEQFLGIRENYDQLILEVLEKVSDYDYILIDCPPAIGALTQSALTAAQLHVLPTQCEFFSAHAIRSALNLIRDIRDRTNPTLRYRVLLTMVDPENNLHQSLKQQIDKAFGEAVFDTVIEIDAQLRESPLFAQPITTYAPESKAAEQYRQLAQELLAHVRERIGKSTEAA